MSPVPTVSAIKISDGDGLYDYFKRSGVGHEGCVDRLLFRIWFSSVSNFYVAIKVARPQSGEFTNVRPSIENKELSYAIVVD